MPTDRTSSHTPEAFEAVARTHYAAVYRAAQHLTRERSAAQDLVQDTYLRASRFFHRLQPGTHARAWLFTILRHTHITGYRKSARHPVWVDVAPAELVCTAPAPAPAGPESGTIEEWLGYVVQDEVQQVDARVPPGVAPEDHAGGGPPRFSCDQEATRRLHAHRH